MALMNEINIACIECSENLLHFECSSRNVFIYLRSMKNSNIFI